MTKIWQFFKNSYYRSCPTISQMWVYDTIEIYNYRTLYTIVFVENGALLRYWNVSWRHDNHKCLAKSLSCGKSFNNNTLWRKCGLWNMERNQFYEIYLSKPIFGVFCAENGQLSKWHSLLGAVSFLLERSFAIIHSCFGSKRVTPIITIHIKIIHVCNFLLALLREEISRLFRFGTKISHQEQAVHISQLGNWSQLHDLQAGK